MFAFILKNAYFCDLKFGLQRKIYGSYLIFYFPIQQNLYNLYFMSNNKLLYEAPVAEALVVRFEGKILQGSVNVQSSSTMPTFVQDAEEDW